jgi:hypothetical protein
MLFFSKTKSIRPKYKTCLYDQMTRMLHNTGLYNHLLPRIELLLKLPGT